MTATHLLGRFVWHDLMTTDLTRSLAFYRELFPEWSLQKLPTGGDVVYHSIRANGLDCGGIVPISADGGIPSHWLGYVAVDDCSAAVRRAEAAGGRCLVPMMSIPGVGKFAVVSDPQGAILKPFQIEKPLSTPDVPLGGQFAWDEMLAPDVSSLRHFYERVFGWSSIETPIENTGVYTLFKVGEQNVAGGLSMPKDAEHPAHWLPYLYADDVDQRSAKALSLGATTFVPPQDIPGIGRFAVHADPTGASFALFRLTAHSI